ncbi:MAG: rhodanese-like domain-containing protein [Burkholderiales bacterium]|nr:rhodanese-like domain-containing protein [Nitrosomonas sp.]MCP5275466.1 rhodanese-like domain-containing protein [Burkholderiales bacterium]
MKNKQLLLILVSLFVLVTTENVKAGDLAPEKIAGARTISTDTAKLLLDRGYPFVDVRGQSDFDKGHLPGAYHLSVKSADFTVEKLSKIAAKDATIIFYCNGVACMGSAMATEKAIQWGWRNIFYYREGYKGWLDAGY